MVARILQALGRPRFDDNAALAMIVAAILLMVAL